MSRHRWIPPADSHHPHFRSCWLQQNPWIYGLPLLFLSTCFISICKGDPSSLELRLANGSSRCAGRVEVKYQGQWGLVCNADWGRTEISVVCKQLRCPSAINMPGWWNWTIAPTPFWLTSVSCYGNESALWDCEHSGWGEQNCTHSLDAQVACIDEAELELRLVDGANRCEGRVELNIQGQWGTVCDDNWGFEEASMVCRQLGCGSLLHFLQNIKKGSGPIWLDDVSCLGNESALWKCHHSKWGEHNCNHDEDVSVTCSDGANLTLRLGSGGSRCSGRVEVSVHGQWGTVCDDEWNKDAGAVVCRQVGCPSALNALIRVNASEDLEPIWFDDVSCNGNESALWDCKHRGWKSHNCGHSEDVGVMCADPSALELRLHGGNSQCAGVVEIRVQEEVGFVCRGGWSLDEANMVCRQLGCGVAVIIPSEYNSGDIQGHHSWISGIRCYGKEKSLGDCGNWEWGRTSCHENEKAAVICSGHMQPRLVGGHFPCSGRLEVNHQGNWVSVCSRDFALQTASVLCRELQCGTLISVLDGAHFGEGSGELLPDELRCEGSESHISLCPTVPIHGKTCGAGRTLGIVCSRYTDFRLVGGSSRCEGRVEIQVQKTWGSLCGSRWNLPNAHVLCKQLDCGAAISIDSGVHFGEAKGPVWGHIFHCSGTESHLQTCPMTALGAPLCSPENTASVNCSAGNLWDAEMQCQDTQPLSPLCSGLRPRINLVNGGDRCAGRVEVYHEGAWGTVCDDAWDLNDAHVVCRQLDCGEAFNATVSAHFGAGSGPIWLDTVGCLGNESTMWQCPSRGWGQHECRHKEDAGVLCSEVMSLRLLNEANTQACSGRLEVFYNGTWGSVGRHNMTADTVEVICKQLGCGDSGTLDPAPTDKASSGTMWVKGIQCPKGPTSLWQCPSDPWEKRPSNAREEAWITCVGKIRLLGGDKCSGRVEVWHEGAWGTVCDNSWDLADAEVACRQLGCGSALAAPREAAFGQGIGAIWLNNVHCKGTESSLWDCTADPWQQTDCGHKEDAGVRCSGVLLTTELQNSKGLEALKLFWILGVILIGLFLLSLFLWFRARKRSYQVGGGQGLLAAFYKKMDIYQKEDEDLYLFNQSEALNGLSGTPRSGSEVDGEVSEPEPHPASWVSQRDASESL